MGCAIFSGGEGPPPLQTEQVYMTITRREYDDSDLYADPKELMGWVLGSDLGLTYQRD
jgi:hypothetical protein